MRNTLCFRPTAYCLLLTAFCLLLVPACSSLGLALPTATPVPLPVTATFAPTPLSRPATAAPPTATLVPVATDLPPAPTPGTPAPSPTRITASEVSLPNGVRVEKVIDANYPTSLAVLPDGRMLYTEKNTGNVRLLVNGVLFSEPVAHLDTDGTNERGLLGIAVDPKFQINRTVWLYHTLPSRRGPEGGTPVPAQDEIVRIVLEGNRANDVQTAFQSPIPGTATNHNGGILRFGPDGMLYVVIGEHANPALAQDLKTVPGKIHRLAPTVPLSPALKNPFGDSSIYAYGVRNSFGMDFDPVSNKLFATINGPTCDDLLVLVLPGSDHGWRPNYPCGDANRNFFKPTLPLLRFDKPVALTQMTFYRGTMFPEWKNDLFFCANNDRVLRHVKLDEARDTVIKMETFSADKVPCALDIETGPDGALWFTNATGIYRITR